MRICRLATSITALSVADAGVANDVAPERVPVEVERGHSDRIFNTKMAGRRCAVASSHGSVLEHGGHYEPQSRTRLALTIQDAVR